MFTIAMPDAPSYYDNPLIGRYASPAMCELWGPRKKFTTWRRLWVWLAEAENELGLPVSTAQIRQLRDNIENLDLQAANDYERKLRHDVMAHVHAYGDVASDARAIIHLGATSCYVTDNTDLILMRDGLTMLARRLATVIDRLAKTAAEHKDLPCLAFTHLQPAQPTTLGKRLTLWIYDLVLDLQELEFRQAQLRARGVKGTTGTQASFLQLFDNDHAKVRQLDALVAKKMGFDATYEVTGQTYSRKVDTQVISTLAGIGQSAHKAATDLRILAHRKEVEEPFEKDQIGSSAMAYKRNPMRAERICGLARFISSLVGSAAETHAVQWLERTLDDSANRRLTIPQAFLALDAILILYQNIAEGLVVYPKVIARNLNEELPFMATESFLMAGVAAGGDRQDLHERIRQASVAAAAEVKQHGRPNDLIERLKNDSAFAKVDLATALDPMQFTGRAAKQVDEFLAEVVAPIRQRYSKALNQEAEVRV